MDESAYVNQFGKSGTFFYHMVRGNDTRIVQPNRKAKSIGAEDTFSTDIRDWDILCHELEKLSEKVASRLTQKKLSGKTLTLKVRFSDFTQLTRNHSISEQFSESNMISETAIMLLKKIDLEDKSIRLLGVTVSNFGDQKPDPYAGQLSLFESEKRQGG